MPASAGQLIDGSRMLRAKHHLDALQTLDLPSKVVAEQQDLLVTETSLKDGGVEGHEAVVFGADEHYLLEFGDGFAAGQLHEQGVVELD